MLWHSSESRASGSLESVSFASAHCGISCPPMRVSPGFICSSVAPGPMFPASAYSANYLSRASSWRVGGSGRLFCLCPRMGAKEDERGSGGWFASFLISGQRIFNGASRVWMQPFPPRLLRVLLSSACMRLALPSVSSLPLNGWQHIREKNGGADFTTTEHPCFVDSYLYTREGRRRGGDEG